MLEGRAANQFGRNLWNISPGKCKFLNLREGKSMHQDRWGTNWLQSIFAAKFLGGISADNNSNTSQQSILRVSHILGCTNRSVASRLREVILALCLVFCETLPGRLCPVLDSPVQDGYWDTRVRLLEHQVDGAQVIQEEADRTGFVQPEDENKGVIKLF